MSRSARRVDGVLLLDKPTGVTSQRAVTRAKSLLHAAKAGHTGTLDPMASGLLPVAFGEATKFTHVLLESDKRYVATVRLGLTTTTGDLEGEVTSRSAVHADRGEVERAVARFRGDILQTPPMYSALKHRGRPLYEYARAGTELERAPRRVTIHALDIAGFDGADLQLEIACSKGTYIRVLAEEVGRELGCGATLAALRRTAAGDFTIERAISFEALEAAPEAERSRWLLPLDALLSPLPAVELESERADRFRRGQAIPAGDSGCGAVRVYDSAARFLGLGDACDGRLSPRRLVSSNGPET